MNTPQVGHTIVDRRSGGKFRILADRKLSREELDEFMKFYLAHGGERPKRGKVISIEYLGA